MRPGHPMSTLARAALLVVALAGPVALATPAAASEGSVPDIVERYATEPDGLLARLDDLFGVGAGGQGIDFDDTTEIGALSRVFAFSDEYLAGEDDVEVPVDLVNRWTAPITVAGSTVGVAVIWINPNDDRPDLAEFDRSTALADALAALPDDASLVRQDSAGAWFALADDVLTPLAPAAGGITEPITLDAYQRIAGTVQPTVPPAESGPSVAALLPGIVVAAAALVVIIVLLLPVLRRRSGDRAADAASSLDTGAVDVTDRQGKMDA